MTDQPKPTRPVSPPPPKPRRYDVTRSQVRSLAEQNTALQQRVDELERERDELQNENNVFARLINMHQSPDLRAATIDELTADLADHKQLLQIKNRQLDTMAADNQRLRELLRRWLQRAQGNEDGTLWIDTQDAIGRTGE